MKHELIIFGIFVLCTFAASLIKGKQEHSESSFLHKLTESKIYNILGLVIGMYMLFEGFNLLSL